MSKQAIGFANKFYTLWTIEPNDVYTTDINGKNWLVRQDTKFIYIKNISFDLDKVTELYPTLDVWEDLRGKTKSWTKTNKDDLCPNIMKIGKYTGNEIEDVTVSDFKYIIWFVENYGNSANGQYAMSLPAVKEYYQNIEDEKNRLNDEVDSKFSELIKVGYVEMYSEKNLSIHHNFGYFSKNIDGCGLYITFKFLGDMFKELEYKGFAYGYPAVGSKYKSIKSKYIRLEFVDISTEEKPFTVSVKSVEFLK